MPWAEADAVQFISEDYKHCKAIAATGAGVELVRGSCLEANKLATAKSKADQLATDAGVATSADAQPGQIAVAYIIKAIAQHRYWSREAKYPVPA